ncbi:MAG: cobalt ECF transporter T component CbiQ [Candidatus Omnitrophica bacterium CG08_land_8_20_14_0_20_41_16]|uniref:Cobalt ECF transporter T component CbiQ n=1 Tax=Candidatus Sherwoodlollariibacterium unditelluris TaxID=1974757 RepID=A0A2G9YIF8_9BACT|nr:MAG: cobalt ECF transporter T component CbiQ [Candidatus Omnitrophica bacterium CG23_combo_of_CG06-09_8_20_14_all_41_10]PIS34270.1 MAG: cobalt ECF transporter T component CbiQ [Candidatus Omnitrophica bacterium CG08_land_8_20_14_0_20_41_16]
MKKKSNFIRRSLISALSFLKDSVFAEEYTSRNGFLQGIDPRLKVASFALFFITAIFLKRAELLILLYGLCLLLALFSKINLGWFLKRTWLFIPVFSLLIVIPALFDIFTPGETLFTLNILRAKLVISRQGFFGARLFVMRVIVSVSFAVLLSITTKHFALLKTFRIFGIPQVFVMTMGMCYRYIYLFLKVVEDTYLAIKSRVGTRLDYKKGQHIVAWNISALWNRSYHLGEDVYGAMLSRGYTAEPVILDDFKTKSRDWLWLFFVVIFFVIILYIDRRVL